MKNKKSALIALAAFGAFLVFSSLAYLYLTNIYEPLEQQGSGGEFAAKEFTLLDKARNSVTLKDFQGKPMLINFWASWCPPCKSEMPHFNTLFKEYGDEVQFVMVDLVDGSRETEETGRRYIEANNFEFPVYVDLFGKMASTYGVMSIPSSFFVNEKGQVVQTTLGAMSEATLRANLEKLLKP